jgi:hypothetical protein
MIIADTEFRIGTRRLRLLILWHPREEHYAPRRSERSLSIGAIQLLVE